MFPDQTSDKAMIESHTGVLHSYFMLQWQTFRHSNLAEKPIRHL